MAQGGVEPATQLYGASSQGRTHPHVVIVKGNFYEAKASLTGRRVGRLHFGVFILFFCDRNYGIAQNA